ATMGPELSQAYTESYLVAYEEVSKAAKEAVLKRARDLAVKDAKAGIGKAHLAEIAQWPEFATMGPDLRAAYTAAYEEVSKAAREAILNRARELGMNDVKAGKGMAHLADIAQWPEFATMGADLRAAYTSAFAE